MANQKWKMVDIKTNSVVYGTKPQAMVNRLFNTGKRLVIIGRVDHGKQLPVVNKNGLVGKIICYKFNELYYPTDKRKLFLSDVENTKGLRDDNKIDIQISIEKTAKQLINKHDKVFPGDKQATIDMIKDNAYKQGLLKFQSDVALKIALLENNDILTYEQRYVSLWEYIERYIKHNITD